MRLAAATTLLLLTVIGVSGAGEATAASSTVSISPLKGTPTALPRTQISFLGASAKALRDVSVVGSVSGRHSGHLKSYAAATGASFKPSKAFTPGEHVNVHAKLKTSKGNLRSLSTSFTIAQPAVISQNEFPPVVGTPADLQSFPSRPDLRPAKLTVNQSTAGVSPGYLFTSPALGPGQYGPMIFDNAGKLQWFRPLAGGEDATDFRTQTYRGKKVLTWWQGRTLQFGFGLGKNVVVDNRYKTVATIKAGNGLQADEHEFSLEPNGSALVLAYSPVRASLASAGGPASGIVLEGIIQQIDVKTGLVMWEWHSLGHVDVSESYSKLPGDPANPYDYFHINSVTTDKHGNFLISARNTWAIYQINGRSGAVTWRLAGKKSSFTLGAGVQFAYQHNAEWLPNGNISLFDDEGAPPIKPPSRGEIVKLDLKAKTATLAQQFVRSPNPLITNSQGNAQSEPNGNWMIGWGGLPNITEFNNQGQVVFDAQFPKGENSYRIYRETWSGQPTTSPVVVAKTVGATTTVNVSWNGATQVASWELLSGSSAASLSSVSKTPKSGFDTAISAPATTLVEVRALDGAGKTLGTSKPVTPTSG
ncbi:MAG TPA: arylsulfotransferase family protein [Solirubrobacteraceae bacterium]|nr:arylsulfotransferase family protein [Solirubrobacteraceae bacterium]